MAQVEIMHEQEDEAAGRWSFDAQVLDGEGALRRFRLTLAWADYNLWSRDGAVPPVAVAEAVLGFLADRVDPADLRPAFDASVVRRLFEDADDEVPRRISNAMP